MNLFELIKNLFKKKITNTNELVRPLDIIKIPSRKEFTNDTLVNYYKDEYHKILSSMKDYDPLYLEADELNNHIKMAVKLLFNISIKEDEIREKSVEARINYLVNRDKLDLYKNDINKLQSEVTGRLIALSEIRKELFLSKKKKEALDNVINRLCLSLNVLYSLEVSIISNIERYKNESKYNYEPSEEEKEEEYEIIKEKIKHLNWLQQVLPLNEQILIRDDLRYLLNDLATLEKKLEEYTYTHKDEITVESKNNEIENLLKIAFDMEHKEELLKRIEQVERKYRLFYEYRDSLEYGDIAVDESDLTNIYNLKFSALTISKDGIVEAIDDATDKIELQYYKNIIFSMLQDIIMGRNEIFNEIFSKDYSNAIKLVKTIFAYHIEYVLINFGLFNFLLSLNSKDGLYNLFTNFKCYRIYYHLFAWDNELPLETICFIDRIWDEHIIVDDVIYNDKTFPCYCRDDMYDLYLIYRKYYKYEEDKYYLPEGIVEILDYNGDLNALDKAIINEIKKRGQDKTICMPKSLKRIVSLRLFAEKSIKSIILNDGLEEIDSRAFYNQEISNINLPSSICTIAEDAFNYHYVKYITINISKNNYTLLSYKNLKNIFNSTIAIKDEYYDTHKVTVYRLKSNIHSLTIHLEDIDDDIIIDLTSILIENNAGNLKCDNFSAYINGLIKIINKKLKDKKKEFNEMQQVLPKSERLVIRKDLKGLLTDLGILNKKLKNYIELHKDEVSKLKKYIEDFNVYKNSYEPTINGIQGTYKIELKPFETKCKLYSHYNMLDKNEINIFYHGKYTYLTSFGVVKPFVNANTLSEELEYYKEIINSKIEHYKNYKANNKDEIIAEKVIKLILKLLGNASAEDILNNFYLLNIFLALDNPQRLYNFFHSFNDTTIPTLFKDSGLIKFEDTIPLSTACLIQYYIDSKSSFDVTLYKDKKYTLNKDFLELFHLIYKNIALSTLDIDKIQSKAYDDYLKSPSEYYLLPEGIKELNLENIETDNSSNKSTLENMQKDFDRNYIILPRSLEALRGNLLGSDVYLNEGLKVLDFDNMALNDDEELIIPSSLTELTFSPNLTNNFLFEEVIFHNFDFANRNVLFKIIDIFLKNKINYFEFKVKLKFRYDGQDEDIIPTLNVAVYNAHTTYAEDYQYRCLIIEDMITNIEKEVQEKRGKSRKLI